MGWDEVCVLCGLPPGRGESVILCPYNQEENVAKEIAEEVGSAVGLPVDDLTAILLPVVSLNPAQVKIAGGPLVDASREVDERYEYYGIGYFGPSCYNYQSCTHHGQPLHPAGDDIQVRRITSVLNGGCFSYLVTTESGERNYQYTLSLCDTTGEVISRFVCVRCFHYLEAWLDCSLSPRIGRSGCPLNLAGELYELVNSRAEPPVPYRGWLPCIDYYGSLGGYRDGCQYYCYVLTCHRSWKHTAKALKDGLRGEELLPSLLRDSAYWMFVEPTM